VEPDKKFASGWDIAEIITVITGIVCAYRRMDGRCVFVSMGTLCLLMGSEPIVKKQIMVRGEIIRKDNDPKRFLNLVLIYIFGSVVFFSIAIFISFV